MKRHDLFGRLLAAARERERGGLSWEELCRIWEEAVALGVVDPCHVVACFSTFLHSPRASVEKAAVLLKRFLRPS